MTKRQANWRRSELNAAFRNFKIKKDPMEELLNALKSTYATMVEIYPLEVEGSEGARRADEAIIKMKEAINNVERNL